MQEFFVDKRAGHRSGNARVYSSLSQAVAALPPYDGRPVRICLAEGVYEENVQIERDHLTLVGAGSEKTVITGSLGAYEILNDGIKRGTFRTQTVFLHGCDNTVRDLTIANTAGPGKRAGQGLALYADGDRLTFENVRLSGYQDTLFTGPLPEKEREPGGFRGPLEHAPRVNGRHYYKKCRIEGTVDFIFGGATAWFEECEIVCRSGDEVCYITAASQPEGQAYGYVFSHCRLTAEPGTGRCWLGRPWREYANVVYLNCEMGAHIQPEGWHDWSSPTDPARTTFAESGSTGPGAAGPRAAYARILTRDETVELTKEKVLGPGFPE